MAATCGAEQSTESLSSLSIHDSGGGGGVSRETNKSSVITIDLNSETPLPYNWEQCLDLKTGEIYFINRRNGMKTVEDPRAMYWYYYYFSEDEDDGSSEYETDEDHNGSGSTAVNGGEENVLVVAGCRSCLMYYMVSKQVKDCPKCNHQLLFHFADSSQAV